MAKSDTRRTARVAVLAYPGCSAWITAGLLEVFGIANVALSIAPPRSGARISRFECHAVGRSRRAIAGSHGVSFAARPPVSRYEAIVVPPLWVESRQELERRLQRMQAEVDLVQRLARRAKIMASACSGGVLLAQAGLLDGRRATTCWWLVDWFRHTFPQVELLPDRLVMQDRDRWTAAAGSAYMHLGLELVRELAGARAATSTARLMLVERRRGSQSPFLAPNTLTPQPDDADVERATRHIDAHLGTPLTVSALCRAVAISERTLARKFASSVGMSPLGYLQSHRVARAKQLLEDSSLPLERIVEQCGYEDISSFRKLFARHVGMTPREYRSRFGTLA